MDTVEAMKARVMAVIESGGKRQPAVMLQWTSSNVIAARTSNCTHGRMKHENCIACYDECLTAALDGRELDGSWV